MGQSKIIFSLIVGQENSLAQWIPMELIPSSSHVNIKETGKPNQFLITADLTEERRVELSCWWNLENTVVLIKHKTKWLSITSFLPSKGNQVLVDRKRLKIK